MKKFISTMTAVLMAFLAMAQAPDIMNYQAVARNNAGQALANQTIRVRLSVVKNAVSQYSETRQVTTNALGLFNVQIGSTGALSTTGNFAGINWQNNGTPGYVLKVELDINNSGLFTDMGSQALVSVPYAFASKDAMNIAGRPVDQTTAPAIGTQLTWDGTQWTPKKDSIIIINQPAADPVPAGGSTGPFVFLESAGTPLPQITVTGKETIIANLSASVATSFNANFYAGFTICYQSLSGGAVFSFGNIQYITVQGNMFRTSVTVTAAKKLPAGTYRIFLGVKNPSETISINAINGITGTIEIRN